uniref:Ribonuclease A-domain domain-containing protein n=1 Tax=Seriola dumerili TaxID=41447 RepID=A0A3B4UTB5_SERDU
MLTSLSCMQDIMEVTNLFLVSLYSYLQGKRLCGRAPVQTFIDARVGAVHQICSRSGLRVQSSPGNLCISRSRMQVFDVISDQNCSMNRMRVQKGSQKVIVACDKVNNRCLPVHFEKNRVDILFPAGPQQH